MKRIIIALILAMTMVISSIAVYAEDTVADAIYENASNTYAVPVLKAGTQPIELLASASGSSPSAGGTTSGAVTEKADEIIVTSAHTNDMYLSEDSFTVYVSFLNSPYVADARENLKVSLIDLKDNVVAECADAKYDDNYNWCIAYTLNIVDKSLFTEDGEYQFEFEYTGDSIVTYQLPAMYIYPYTDECIKDYELTDKTTATVNVTIANADEDALYYAYHHDSQKYFYPVSRSGNVYTFCFDEVYNDIIMWNRINISTSIYRIYDEYNTGREDADMSMDNFIGDVYIEGYIESQTTFNDEWNGIEVLGSVASTDKTMYLTLEPYEGQNTATGKDGMVSYTEEDKQYISIALYDGITYSTIPVTYSLEYYTGETEGYNDYYKSYFDAEVSLSKTLTADHKYYIIVTDKYSTRIKEFKVNDGIYCDYPCINDGNYYSEYSFYFADTYDCALFETRGFTDTSKLDAKILNYMGEEVATLDKTSIDADTYGNCTDIYFDLKSTNSGITNNYSYYNFNIYYDGKVVKSQRMSGYYGGNSGGNEGYYYNFYTSNSYVVNNEKLVVLANLYTDNPHYTIDDFNLKLYTNDDANNEITLEKKSIVSQMYDSTYFVMEYDIQALSNYNFYYQYSFDNTEYYTSHIYANYTEDESFFFELTNSDDEYYTVLGYNLTPGSYTVYMISEESGEQYTVPATVEASNTYALKLKLSDVPDDIMKKYGFVEFDGKFVERIPLYDFTYKKSSNSSFFSEFLNQNNRLAIVNLPSDLYTSYRISTDENALSSISYSAVKNQIIYKMPDTDGNYMLYAQFKDANGRESGVFKTKINLVTKAPDFKIADDLSKTYTSSSNYGYTINAEASSSVDGDVYIQLYTDTGSTYFHNNGSSFGEMRKDSDELYLYITENYEYLRFVNKMEIWLEDNYGNKSEPVSYDVKFSGRYIDYEIGDGYIYFDTQEGRVISLNNLSGHVTIPSYIEGIKVRALDSYILTNSPDIISISLPSTIESMPTYALNYNYNITIYVNEGSYAHSVLSGAGYNVVLKGNCGDINGDGVITGADLLRLAKYFANWNVTIEEETSDTNADGEVNAADVLRLAKYLAGHNVTLGE